MPADPPPTSGPDAVDLALEHLLVGERGDPEAAYPSSGLPCPSWCQEAPGHPFDTLHLHATDGSQDCPARFHARTLHWTDDGLVVGLQSVEALQSTRLVRHPVHVFVEAQVCSLTPDEARDVAQQLVAAAEEAERLRSDTSTGQDA